MILGKKSEIVVKNFARNVEIYKTFLDDISLILQYFATKLCIFTKLKTFFLAVVMDFALLTKIKIESIAEMVYSKKKICGSSDLPQGPL